VRYTIPLCLLLAPCALTGQTRASVRRAVGSITPEDLRRHIGVLADDSMRGRATPSPELEKVAAYIAGEFKRVGLKPGGERGTYLQRYSIERLQLVAESSVVSLSGAVTATWRLGTDLQLFGGSPPSGATTGAALLVTGTPTADGPLDSAAIAGKVVFVPFDGAPAPVVRLVRRLHPAAVIGIGRWPDSIWSMLAARQTRIISRNPGQGAPGPPAFITRDMTAQPLLAQAGLDLDSSRAAMSRPVALQPLSGVSVRLAMRERVLERASAPNVIGILEGSDPKLKNEYVFFTAHMDHIGTPGAGEGCAARGGDSVCNGADDDASGSAAVIEAANAFSLLTPHPRRSLVFMTVSGEERGLWGSSHFVEHPTVPLQDIVADLNTDMVGRNWKDTIAVIGKEHSDLGATLNRVAASHPELHMTPIDDIWPQEGFYFRSDHYNFARKGIPILFFFNGTHPDYHEVSDELAKIDAEKESRIVKLDFYLGLEIAGSPERPKWNPESYKRIVQGAN